VLDNSRSHALACLACGSGQLFFFTWSQVYNCDFQAVFPETLYKFQCVQEIQAQICCPLIRDVVGLYHLSLSIAAAAAGYWM
jgi:hypothetical protein